MHDYFIKKVFTKESKEPNDVYIIFGDTGTGKTAALVHLFDDYVTQYKQGEHPYPNIKFFSLRDTTLESISNLPDKKNTILLLDALDETPAAQDPILFLQFQKDLQSIFHGFARVVITCRPQLFSNQKATSDFIHTEDRTSTGWVQCTELFLAPFDNWQINQYLNQVFPLYKNFKKRRTARKIVKKHAYIAIRPLVLTYIKDIVETKRNINTTLDLYDIIIEKTLQRDLERIYPNPSEEQIQQWWDITSDVAGYMYRNNKLSITNQELDTIPSVAQEPQFKQRSMLTRTGDEFHFPHKSFYEYFMAYRFLLNPMEILEGTLYTMYFALQRYEELYNAYKEKRSVRFAKLESLSKVIIANSLHNIGSSIDDINHFSEAEPKYNAALEMFRQLEEQYPGQLFIDDVAMTLNNLANLHTKTNNYPAAEKDYTMALKTYRNLAEKNPDTYLPYVATTLNNIGELHRNTNNYPAAEEEYTEALKIRRGLAKKDPDTYLPYVAGTLENLAVLHQNTNRYDEAEKEYNDVLKIRQKLAKNNPDAYLHNVAHTLNNLGSLHDDLHKHSAAEKELPEALKTYRNLAEKNPDTFIPYVASILENLAILHKNAKRFDEAEKEYNDVLNIRQKLAKNNPDAYLHKVAQTLNNLAVLHRKTNNYPAAEEEYTEALKTYRNLAEKNPDAFLPDVAMTLNNLAVLHRKTNNYPAAEKENTESLNTYRDLAEKYPDAFLPDVAMTLYNMASLYLVKEEKDLPAAEAAAQESLEKYKIMAEKSHAAFDPYVKKAEELLDEIQQLKQQK